VFDLHRLALAAIIVASLVVPATLRRMVVALDKLLALRGMVISAPARGPLDLLAAAAIAGIRLLATTAITAVGLLSATTVATTGLLAASAALMCFLLALAMFLSTAVTALLGSNGSGDRQRGCAGG
jgi:hypothetical protein